MTITDSKYLVKTMPEKNTQDDVHILCKLNVDCYLKTLQMPHKNAEHLKTIY